MDCLTVEDWSDSMSNWMSHSNWVSNSMSNWMSNNSWVSNSMGNRVSNNSSLDYSRSILRNSLIGDILNDSISVVSIGDSLSSSIGKSNGVASRCSVSISGLSLLEVSSTVVIIDSICVTVYWGFSEVNWSSYKGTSRGTSSSSYKSSNNKGLHDE